MCHLRVQQYIAESQSRPGDIWDGFCDLGLPGLLVAADHGGAGLSLLEAALVAETLGSRMAPAPFVATAILAPLAISAAGTAQQQARWLPELAEGRVVAGAAIGETVSAREGAGVRSAGGKLNGRALFVLDFAADLYLVADEQRVLYLVEADSPGLARCAGDHRQVTPTGRADS